MIACIGVVNIGTGACHILRQARECRLCIKCIGGAGAVTACNAGAAGEIVVIVGGKQLCAVLCERRESVERVKGASDEVRSARPCGTGAVASGIVLVRQC